MTRNRWLHMLVVFLALPSMAGAFFDSGRSFKDGLVNGIVVNEAEVQKLAKESPDIFSFIARIYDSEIVASSSDTKMLGGAFLSNLPIDYYPDIETTKILCDSKAGSYFAWRSINEAYPPQCYACEKANQIDFALCITTSKSQTARNPYVHRFVYMGKRGFESYLAQKKVLAAVDSSKSVAITPGYAIGDNGRYYILRLNYKNMTGKPVTIDFTKSFLMLNGAEYALDFQKSNDAYRWLSYDSDNFRFADRQMTQVRLNPNQVMSATIGFNLSGIRDAALTDKGTVLVVDGVRFENFADGSEYSLRKVPITDLKKRWR